MMDNEPANILLIEDNPGDADLVRLRLVESKSEVHVNCVPRLSDALECLDAETPSLVLLDLNLPDSHGAETFRRILQKAPNVPVVILSGQDDQALAIKAVHMGVQDYLIKGDITSKQLERAGCENSASMKKRYSRIPTRVGPDLEATDNLGTNATATKSLGL